MPTPPANEYTPAIEPFRWFCERPLARNKGVPSAASSALPSTGESIDSAVSLLLELWSSACATRSEYAGPDRLLLACRPRTPRPKRPKLHTIAPIWLIPNKAMITKIQGVPCVPFACGLARNARTMYPTRPNSAAVRRGILKRRYLSARNPKTGANKRATSCETPVSSAART